MITVFYTKVSSELTSEQFNTLIKLLPQKMQDQVLKYRRWQDRQASMFGKLLLLQGMHASGVVSFLLDDVKYSALKRPYVEEEIDFNISHSGPYILCAFSNEGRVGVDVEEIKEIPIADFKEQFSAEELTKMLCAENSLKAFYELWTRKEAFLKAIGTGLYLPLNQVLVNQNKIHYQSSDWFLNPLYFEPDYCACICTNVDKQEIILEKVDFL